MSNSPGPPISDEKTSLPAGSVSQYYRQDGGISGGYAGLKAYAGSTHSSSNEKLIRGIAEDAAGALGMSTKFASGPLENVIRELKKRVPDPSSDKWIQGDATKHEKICAKMANLINKRYDSQMIDTNASPQEICHGVAETIYLLAAGLKGEFGSVKNDVDKNLKNLKLLKTFVAKARGQLDKLSKSTGSKVDKKEVSQVETFYQKIDKEIDRQMTILTDVLGATVEPVTADLEKLLDETHNLKKLMKEIKLSVGSDDFSRSLSFILRGQFDVARATSSVKKALEKIGMTVGKYQNTKSMEELKKTVTAHVASKSKSSEEHKKVLEAIEILYENDFANDDIVLNLTNKKGGMDFDKTQEEYQLGERDERSHRHTGRDTFQKQIRLQKEKRKVLFDDFKKQLKNRYQQLVDSVSKIPKKIGNSIPVTDELGDFVTFYRDLANPQREDVHLCLSGYRKDITSRSLRADILSNLKTVSVSLEPLKSGPGGSDFKAIQSAVQSLAALIDSFHDKHSKGLEVKVSLSKKGGDGYVNELLAGANLVEGSPSMTTGGALTFDMPGQDVQIMDGPQAAENDLGGSLIVNPTLEANLAASMAVGGVSPYPNIANTQRALVYYYNIANIRSTMKESARDLAEYGKDYENILGDEIGHMVDLVTLRYNKEMENAPRGTGDAEAAKKQVEAWKYIKTRQKNAKIQLLKAAEALDLYMQKFTNSVASDPTGVKDVVRSLESINIAARWFTDKSGDTLAEAFECWPGKDGKYAGDDGKELKINGVAAPLDDEGRRKIPMGDHYYNWVALAEAGAQPGPGNPNQGFIPSSAEQVKGIYAKIDKSVKGMRALENIVSTFAGVGKTGTSGGTFMTHGQIFKALSDYIVASSIALGFDESNTSKGNTASEVVSWARGNKAKAAKWMGLLYKAASNLEAAATEEKIADPGGVATVAEEIAIANTRKARAEVASALGTVVEDVRDYLKKVRKEAEELGLDREDATIEVRAAMKIDESLSKFAKDAGLDAWSTTLLSDDVQSDIRKRIFAVAQVFSKDNTALTLDGKNRAVNASFLEGLQKIIESGISARADSKDLAGVVGGAVEAKSKGGPQGGVMGDQDRMQIGMRSIKGGGQSVNGFNNEFTDTDPLFTMMVKSIVCKVLTVVGVYSLFNRPGVPSTSITPLRQILGGKRGGGTAIIPEATELYARLPLLGEWYREKFGFNEKTGNDAGADAYIISMVPDFDGVWSDFVKLIFVDVDFIKDGTYADGDVDKLINACNDIYRHYKSKSPKGTCRYAMQQFVKEINRRFGFVKRKEIKAYYDEKDHYLNKGAGKGVGYDKMYPKESTTVDFDLLNSEKKGRGVAPSDRFQKVTATAKGHIAPREKAKLWKIAEIFRDTIEGEMCQFAGVGAKDNWASDKRQTLDPFYFRQTLRITQNKLTKVTSPTHRYNIVRDLIQGADRYANISSDKLLMLNEIVRGPLAALNSTRLALQRFTDLVHATDLGRFKDAVDKSEIKTDTAATNASILTAWNALLKAEAKNGGGRNAEYEDILKMYLTGTYTEGQWTINAAVDEAIAHGDAAEKKSLVCRYGFDHNSLMRDLTEALFSVGCDLNGLVDVRVGTSGCPIINFSKLSDHCTQMLNQVKTAVDKFRGIIPSEFLDAIVGTKGAAGGTFAPGGILWLEERLIENLIKNKSGKGLPEVNQSLAHTWKFWATPYAQLDDDAAGSVTTVTVDGVTSAVTSKISFDNAMSGLVYWDYRMQRFGADTGKAGSFPFTHLPTFKSGNFEPTTADEKRYFDHIKKHVGMDFATAAEEQKSFAAQYAAVFTAEDADTKMSIYDSVKSALGSMVDATFNLDRSMMYVASDTDQWDLDGDKAQMGTNVAYGKIWKIVNDIYWRLIEGDMKDDNKTKKWAINQLKDLAEIKKAAVDKTDKLAEIGSVGSGDGGLRLIRNRVNLYLPDGKHGANVDGIGLIMHLNRTLGRMLNIVNDTASSHKVYLPLVEPLANGACSSEVMQGQAFRDVNFPDGYFAVGNRGRLLPEPPANTALAASLARSVRSIVTAKRYGSTDALLAFATLDQVPTYIQESMRAHLPVFDKHLELIVRKADFVKSIITNSNLSLKRVAPLTIFNPANGLNAEAAREEKGLSAASNVIGAAAHDARKTYLTGLCSKVVSAARSAQKGVKHVYKELNDVPIYLETCKDSIKDFRDRYNTIPLMPLSTLAHFASHSNKKVLLPKGNTGSDEFKLRYGTRYLLGSTGSPDLEYMPGVKSLVEKYNAVSKKSAQMSPSSLSSLFKNTVHLYRYVVDMNTHKSYLGQDLIERKKVIDTKTRADLVAVGVLAPANVATRGDETKLKDLLPIQYSMQTDAVVRLTEDSDVRNSVQQIILTHNKGNLGYDRIQTRLVNIMDMNIVPINMHAMQREIPLVNLFNYSYTFDRMVYERLAPHAWTKQCENKARRTPAATTTNLPEFTAKMVSKPYSVQDATESLLLRRLMVGGYNNSKPKYNSDQLWNKVLLQDSFKHDQLFLATHASAATGFQTPAMQAYGTPSFVDTDNKLSYLKRRAEFGDQTLDGKTIVQVPVSDAAEKVKLEKLGLVRYDTQLVRTLSWSTNLQKMLRVLMRDQLHWIDTPVVKGISALDPRVTDYGGLETFNPQEF